MMRSTLAKTRRLEMHVTRDRLEAPRACSRIRVAAALLTVLLACVSLQVVGCSAAMTYPEYPGAPKADPSLPPLPNLMADAITFVHGRVCAGSELVFDLPPNTPKQVWRVVAKRLGTGRVMREGDKSVLYVRQVRLSGGRAEVDVVYPTDGIYQLATVHFTGATGQPFYPKMLQLWLVPTDTPVCNTPPEVAADPNPQP